MAQLAQARLAGDRRRPFAASAGPGPARGRGCGPVVTRFPDRQPSRGAAFGLNLGSPLIHTVVSIAALALLVYLFRTLPVGARLLRIALAMVLGGALGNIVDRIRLEKGVVDFFAFGLGEQWRWPVFNVADSFVTVGVILLAIGYSRQDKIGAPPGQTDP